MAEKKKSEICDVTSQKKVFSLGNAFLEYWSSDKQ